MSTGASAVSAPAPAQLGFLAIYNPSLGSTDETLEDQIVYYYSSSSSQQQQQTSATASAISPHKLKRRSETRQRGSEASSSKLATATLSARERNERLRQIGLAQGTVEFARGFSGGSAVDTVETERTRVVMKELEKGWWILAVSSSFH